MSTILLLAVSILLPIIFMFAAEFLFEHVNFKKGGASLYFENARGKYIQEKFEKEMQKMIDKII